MRYVILASIIDARCISGNPKAVSDGTVYYQKKVRCHNRQIHKNTILKNGIRKRNQAPYNNVMGLRLNVWLHGKAKVALFLTDV